MLDNTEWAINNGQSRDTGNIGYARWRIKMRWTWYHYRQKYDKVSSYYSNRIGTNSYLQCLYICIYPLFFLSGRNNMSTFKGGIGFWRYSISMIFNWLIWFLVFNATFSKISAISWRPVLVVEDAEVPGENHRPWASNW